MCFQEKMLATVWHKEFDSGVLSFRLCSTLQLKVDWLDIRLRASLCNRFLDLCRDFFHRKRGKNRHSANQSAQRNVGVAIFADELERILRLPNVCGLWI